MCLDRLHMQKIQQLMRGNMCVHMCMCVYIYTCVDTRRWQVSDPASQVRPSQVGGKSSRRYAHLRAHTHMRLCVYIYIYIHIHILKVVCIYTSTNLYVYNTSMHKCWLRVHSFVDVLYTYMYVSLFHYVCVRSTYL